MNLNDLTDRLDHLWVPQSKSRADQPWYEKPTIWEGPAGHAWQDVGPTEGRHSWLAKNPYGNKENIPPGFSPEGSIPNGPDLRPLSFHSGISHSAPPSLYRVPQPSPDAEEMDHDGRSTVSYLSSATKAADVKDDLAHLFGKLADIIRSMRKLRGERTRGQNDPGNRCKIAKVRQRKRCRFAPTVTFCPERQESVGQEEESDAPSDGGCWSDQERSILEPAGSRTIAASSFTA
jgi:hypothetical protein